MLSIDGLVSGLDTTAIIDGLLSIQQRQIKLLSDRQQKVVAEQTAFKGVEGQLVNLKSRLSGLANRANSVFGAKQAKSSNEQVLVAAASDSAVKGVYSVRVNSLARTHQVASQGFSDADGAISEGTLEIRVGTAQPLTVTIDSSNNTLQGLADAINDAGGDVSASIINSGSDQEPFRLLLTSSQTGAANTITINNNLAGGANQPQFDLDNPVQEASDASITLGSGAGAITIASSRNTVENVIPGVTLDLLTADPDQVVTVEVKADTEAAQTAITGFVESFNALMSFIDDQVRYESETGQASPLLGNRSVISIQDDVRRAVGEVVVGVSSDANRLSAIGISFTDKGQLIVNQSKLSQALSGELEGVGSGDLRRLFALDGESDNPNIDFVVGSARTRESINGYGVDITSAAERARITAANDLSQSTTIDGSNNVLEIKIDGASSGELLLTEGVYSQEELAQHIESVLNSTSTLAGRSVSVALDGGKLQITSNVYGGKSEVTIVGGSSLGDLGFDGFETDRGQDVAGSFIVNGVAEEATGRGRLLVGNPDNANTANLQLRISLPSGQVQDGVDGTLNVTRGLASRLDKLFGSLLDPVTGRFASLNQSYDSSVKDIQASIDRQNEAFETQRASLEAQFVALETTLADLQSTNNYVLSQLASIRSFR